MIHNGIITMDRVIEIETSPAYASWRWYAGALQQNHYALLMVVEMSLNPRRKEWAKIWRGLDYVFEKPNTWPPIQKARRILNELRWKMRLFTGQRKLRAPQEVKQRLEEAVQFEKDEQERREISSSGNSETWEGSSGIVSLTQREALPEADTTGDTAQPQASKDQVPSSRVDNNDANVVEQPNPRLRTYGGRQPQQSHREPSAQVPNSAYQHLKPNIPYGGSFLVEVPKPEIYVNWVGFHFAPLRGLILWHVLILRSRTWSRGIPPTSSMVISHTITTNGNSRCKISHLQWRCTMEPDTRSGHLRWTLTQLLVTHTGKLATWTSCIPRLPATMNATLLRTQQHRHRLAG